jgi:DNA-binding NarL/FixJ family response regulator
VSARRAVAVLPDLFFATRVRTAAIHLGVALDLVAARELAETCRKEPADLAIVDLADEGAVAAIEALAAVTPRPCARLVAFGAHVDRERLAAARAAGADDVMPRSLFTARLPALLAGTEA